VPYLLNFNSIKFRCLFLRKQTLCIYKFSGHILQLYVHLLTFALLRECGFNVILYFKNTICFKNYLPNKWYHVIKMFPDNGDSPEPVR